MTAANAALSSGSVTCRIEIIATGLLAICYSKFSCRQAFPVYPHGRTDAHAILGPALPIKGYLLCMLGSYCIPTRDLWLRNGRKRREKMLRSAQKYSSRIKETATQTPIREQARTHENRRTKTRKKKNHLRGHLECARVFSRWRQRRHKGN